MTLTQNYKFAKFGPKTQIFSNLYKISHSQQIEHATYEYNFRQCLERSINQLHVDFIAKDCKHHYKVGQLKVG